MPEQTTMLDSPPPHSRPPRRPVAGLGYRGATVLVALGLMGGGVAGGFLVAQAATSASSGTSTGSTGTSGTASPAAQPFHSNEDPTHEAGESAQREAQENSGQMPAPPAGSGTSSGGGA